MRAALFYFDAFEQFTVGMSFVLKRLFWLTVFFLALSSPLLPASAAEPPASAERPKPVALLIANSAYPDDMGDHLKHPAKDARRLADELKKRGFDVDIKQDLTREQMQSALDSMYSSIKPGSPALIYFSGYGIQSNGRSYMMPTTVSIWADGDVRRDGFDIQAVIEEMSLRRAALMVAILDASRKTPWERHFRDRSTGLAPIIGRTGSIVIYSAAPNAVVDDEDGETSLFMRTLLKGLQTPGLTVDQAFNATRSEVSQVTKGDRVPWVSSNVVGDVFINPQATTGRSGQPLVDPCAGAEAHWKSAEAMGTRMAYADHLARFEDCQFATLAQTHIDVIDQAAAQKEEERNAKAQEVAEEAAQKEREQKAAEAEQVRARKAEEERVAQKEAQKAADQKAADFAAAQKLAEQKAAEEAARKADEQRAAEAAARKDAERKEAELAAARKAAEQKAAELTAQKAAEEAGRRAAEQKAANLAADLAAARKLAEQKAAEQKAAEYAAQKATEQRAAEETARKAAEQKAAQLAADLAAARKLAEQKAADQRVAELAVQRAAAQKVVEEAAKREAERKEAEQQKAAQAAVCSLRPGRPTLMATGGAFMGGPLFPISIRPDFNAAKPIRAIEFSPEGKVFATAGDDGVIRIWDVLDFRLLKTLRADQDPVLGISFWSDGSLLASASATGTIRVWDVRNSRVVNTFQAVADFGNRSLRQFSVAFAPDRVLQYLVSVGDDGRVWIWDLQKNILRKVRTSASEKLSADPTVRSIGFAPNPSGQFVTAGFDGAIRFYTGPGEPDTYPVYSGKALRVVYSPDGRRVLSAGVDRNMKNLKLWDAKTHAVIRNFEGHTDYVISAAWSADGTRIVSGGGGRDHAVRVWDAERGTQLQTLVGHREDVEAVAFVPGQDWVVSVSEDKTLKLWDIASGRELLSVVAFTDGEYLTYTSTGCYAGSPGTEAHFKVFSDGFARDVTQDVRKTFFVSGGILPLLTSSTR